MCAKQKKTQTWTNPGGGALRNLGTIPLARNCALTGLTLPYGFNDWATVFNCAAEVGSTAPATVLSAAMSASIVVCDWTRPPWRLIEQRRMEINLMNKPPDMPVRYAKLNISCIWNGGSEKFFCSACEQKWISKTPQTAHSFRQRATSVAIWNVRDEYSRPFFLKSKQRGTRYILLYRIVYLPVRIQQWMQQPKWTSSLRYFSFRLNSFERPLTLFTQN